MQVLRQFLLRKNHKSRLKQCYNLSPAELSNNQENNSFKTELISIINSLAKQFSEKTKNSCSVGVDDNFEYPVLEREKIQNLFRVIQEALTNIEKHSFATKVSILIKKENQKLVIYITDEGMEVTIRL